MHNPNSAKDAGATTILYLGNFPPPLPILAISVPAPRKREKVKVERGIPMVTSWRLPQHFMNVKITSKTVKYTSNRRPYLWFKI